MDAQYHQSHIAVGKSFADSSSNVSIVCVRDNQSAHFHTKSWSYSYKCPGCGKSRRYNRNFLGNKYEVVCDGAKITRRMKQVWVERLKARA